MVLSLVYVQFRTRTSAASTAALDGHWQSLAPSSSFLTFDPIPPNGPYVRMGGDKSPSSSVALLFVYIRPPPRGGLTMYTQRVTGILPDSAS